MGFGKDGNRHIFLLSTCNVQHGYFCSLTCRIPSKYIAQKGGCCYVVISLLYLVLIFNSPPPLEKWGFGTRRVNRLKVGLVIVISFLYTCIVLNFTIVITHSQVKKMLPPLTIIKHNIIVLPLNIPISDQSTTWEKVVCTYVV